MVSKASVRLMGGKQVHVRVKGKKKYVGMYNSIASAAQAFHLATAKVQGGGSLQPAFSVGTRVYAAGQEGREEAAGSIVSYDWTTDVYKVSVGDGKGGEHAGDQGSGEHVSVKRRCGHVWYGSG